MLVMDDRRVQAMCLMRLTKIVAVLAVVHLACAGLRAAGGDPSDPLPAGAIAQFGSPRFQDSTIDRAASFSPDGRLLATCGANSPILVWDVASGNRIRSHAVRGSVFDLRWRRDGVLSALTFFGHDVFLMEEFAAGKGRSPEEEARIEEEARKRETRPAPDDPKRGRLYSCFLSRDGRWVVAIRNRADKPIQWAELYRFTPEQSSNSARAECRVDLPDGYGVWLSHDNRFLFAHAAATKDQRNRIVAFDVTAEGKGKVAWEIPYPGDQYRRPGFFLSSDGKRVVIRFSDDTVELWDGPSGKRLRELPKLPTYYHHNNGEWPAIDLSPDGKKLALVERRASGIVGGRIIDVETGKELCTLAPGPMPRISGGARFSADGQRLSVVSYGVVRVWDTHSGEEICPLPGHRGTVNSLVVIGDGKRVVTAGADLTVRMWEPATEKEVWRTVVPQSGAVKFATAEDVVIAEDAWGTESAAKRIGLASGKVLPLPGKLGEAQHDAPLAISPDGKTVVTLSIEKPAFHVWSWAAGDLLRTILLIGPDRTVLRRCPQAEFTPDGKQFVAVLHYGDADRRPFKDMILDRRYIERWDLAAGKMLERLEVGGNSSAFLIRHRSGLFQWTKGREVRDVVTGLVAGKMTPDVNPGFYAPWAPAAVLSPDEQRLGLGEYSSGRVLLFEMRTGHPRGSLQQAGRYLAGLQFLPDGKLVTLGDTATVWAVGLRCGVGSGAALKERDMTAAWDRLSDPNPEKAYQGMEKLAAAPAGVVEFVRRQVRVVPKLSDAAIEKIFRKLDSDAFKEREEASKELGELGVAAVAAVKARLAGSVSAEAKRRLEEFLAAYNTEEIPPDELRALRAVEVLEAIDSPAARKFLIELADGAPGARLTQAAAAAVRRLAR
jgi:WD40 repeat protein